MSEYIIKNGHVFDPVQGIKGDKADVAIKDGKIVDKVGSGAKVIDAKGKTVMAGAVEIHAHIAGPKVNMGRIYRPEDKLFTCTPTKGMERMGGGNSIPTTFKTGYEYAKMGYTTAMEAAMPPLFSRHVHEEIRDTPIIDEAAFPVFGNNWFVMEYLKNKEVENTAAYIAWLIRVTKGYAVKVVNPGGTEAWAWGLNCLSVNDPVPYFDITPAEIVKGLIEANEFLGLPHSLHIHPNNLGNPGCYETTLDTLKLAEGFKAKNKFGREQVMHLTHSQFHSYGGTNWGDFESKAKEVTDYVNKNKNITIDTGNVTLDETTTMTADGPFEHHLTGLNNLKWANIDVELETGSGVVPYIYSPSISVCAIQWAIGLEIALMMKDPMRCYITTDHPNAGPFTRYPRVIKWLMSTKAREAQINAFKHKDKVLSQTSIGSLDREISLYELAQMTRAGPAKSLGLTSMCGGLKPGMDADVAVYNFDPDQPVANPDDIEKAFSRCSHVFKCGVEVVTNGEIVSNGHKRTLWVNAKVKENPQVMRDINEKFLKYYSMTQANYEALGHHFVPNPYTIEVDATEVQVLTMETVTITMKNPPALYLEADNVSPDVFAGKTAAQIAELHVHEGNVTSTLGKYFDISGNAGATASDTKIIVKGDMKRVKYLGFKMSAGEIAVESSTDQYAGAWMKGGKMLVKGNVDAFAGTAMKGGELTIEGNAGNYLGAAYRGDWRGMSGGKILVKGNAGSDIGMYMTGGEMIINGNADVHVCTHAEGGKVIIKGNAKTKIGGQMVGGDIFVFGTIDVMMPGFKPAGEQELEVDGVKAKFAHYIGDTGERHKKKKGQVVYGNLYKKI